MCLDSTNTLNLLSTPKIMDMKKLRQKAGIRAEEVAVSLEIALSTIRNWEQGRTIPRLRADQFFKLLRLYNCTAEELERAFKETNKVSNNN